MKQYHIPDNTFFFRLVKRITLFLFLFQAVLLLLFIAGNFQSFLDSNLRFIFLCCSIISALLFFCSCLGIIDSIIMAIQTKQRKYIFYIFRYFVFVILATIIFVLLRGISFLSSGITL